VIVTRLTTVVFLYQ